ncbi:hypothetical protein BD779DRAFT_237087 [Infundibulicybe gibba]|nr:hypothetical protein BD779DRAFT_237087 [Infundibulicybe gibba]
MSIKLLADPASRHELQDDLESFFWAVVYHGFRYLELEVSVPQTYLQDRMKSIFDSYRPLIDGSLGGGVGKIAFLWDPSPTLGLKCKPMQKWIDAVMNMVKAWIDYVKQRKLATHVDPPIPNVPNDINAQKLVMQMD